MYKLISIKKHIVNEKEADISGIIYISMMVKAKYGAALSSYIANIKQNDYINLSQKNIGSIVMNANPFTYGHLHLIETALEKIDILYIFVVEEDKSFFSFTDRLSLIKAGISHIKKPVFVVPSGKFIISTFSFPSYFSKDIKFYNADSSLDILLFGSIIAPALGITTRFAGEEPNCPVTAEYNTNMLNFLPALNISVQIIPRKKSGEVVISASTVRKLLAQKNFNRLKDFVPPTTFAYLIEKFADIQEQRS
jgi:[citrate (pro-3S)-lyase] ligase